MDTGSCEVMNARFFVTIFDDLPSIYEMQCLWYIKSGVEFIRLKLDFYFDGHKFRGF